MSQLKLAPDLSLPLDAVTQTFLIFGKRGSGKSSTATRGAEQMIAGRVPIAVLDPVDVWWGLKAGKDGSRKGGLEVFVFGGAHADLPLEPTAGALMADTIVDHRINAVFVLRQFSNREKARFVSEFADRLFQRNRGAMHLFCEEAHELMPQNPYGGEEEMLGRMLRLQKLGRTSGIGMTSITQRPASLNKNATTQGEILVAHRIMGPQDRRAIEEWIKYHHAEAEKEKVLQTLPELKTGEAWVWAPDFPEDDPIGLQRVKMLLPDTFDSRRTPKPGESQKQPKQLAPVDLEKLRDKMAATIERAKAEDPRELKQQLVKLRRELEAAKTAKPAPAGKERRVEVPVVKDAQIQRLERVAEKLSNLGEAADDKVQAVDAWLQRATQLKADLAGEAAALRASIAAAKGGPPPATPTLSTIARPSPPPPRQAVQRTVPAPRPATTSAAAAASNGDITAYQQDILDAAGRFHSLGMDWIPKRNLAALAGKSPRSSEWDRSLANLRGVGLLEYGTGSTARLTSAGKAAAAPVDSPLTSKDLIAAYKQHVLDEYEGKLFTVLVDLRGAEISREELSERTGLSVKSSQFDNAMASMRKLGIIEYMPQRTVKASESLFVE